MTRAAVGADIKLKMETITGKINNTWWETTSVEEKQLFLAICIAERMAKSIDGLDGLAAELRTTVALIVTTMAQFTKEENDNA